jgi:ribosome biogenesis GTPase
VLVIDTPGMREIQLWESEETLASAFDDAMDLAEACRFRDCRHEKEPGCALQEAVAEGRLLPERLESYKKLQREAASTESLKAERLKVLEKKRNIRSLMRSYNRLKRGR